MLTPTPVPSSTTPSCEVVYSEQMVPSADQPSSGAVSDSSIAEPSHGLVLPNELLTMIAGECDPADLKNMRLASRLMHQISTRPFARKSFSRRRFLFTYQSMKALVDITAHPTFGTHLRCISFGTYRMIEDPERHDFPGQSEDWLARYRSVEAIHRRFRQRDQHIEMLVLALKNLITCQNNTVILGIHDDFHRDEYRRRGYAFQASYQDLDALEVHSTAALDAVLTARRQSGFPLTALKLCLSEASESLSELALEPNTVLDSVLPSQISVSTTALDFHVNVWQEEGSHAKVKILSKFTRLELSRLSIDAQELSRSSLKALDEDSYGRIWETIISCPLQSISLERSDADSHHFVHFLQNHKDRLKTLKLRQVRIIAFEPPQDVIFAFLRFLRDSLRLVHLSINNLSVVEKYVNGPMMYLPALEQELVFEGREEVNEGLEGLIEEIKQDYRDDGSDDLFSLSDGEHEDD
ncbi:hypothetical protein M436DRAFT_65032 [Aureobasidium namibiae CBS 147.97]|uniref:F-box domain-containing protein n=1 Tax=Aureobasidium namibiae CBS 147.97 TaxID=1043004 RepID=A0A074XCB2_9PEZI